MRAIDKDSLMWEIETEQGKSKSEYEYSLWQKVLNLINSMPVVEEQTKKCKNCKYAKVHYGTTYCQHPAMCEEANGAMLTVYPEFECKHFMLSVDDLQNGVRLTPMNVG